MLRIRLVAVAVAIPFAPQLAAVEVSVSNWAGREVVLIEGPIVAGDHALLDKIIMTVRPFPHGSIVVLLNSGGGNVDEAFKIAEILTAVNAHTIVSAGADCASACLIPFMGGYYRTVEDGERLGQHSCSVGGVPAADCNERIANYAFTRGVSHGSIAAFMTNVAPQDIFWFNRAQTDCWGISYYPFSSEGGFEKSEPCPMETLLGEMPPSQQVWRVEIYGDGYRAFFRPFYDHVQELEVGMFCRKDRPGQLFLTMDIFGSVVEVQGAIVDARFKADNGTDVMIPFSVDIENDLFTRVTSALPPDLTFPFLTSIETIELSFEVHPPFERIWVRPSIGSGRQAMAFVASNCLNT